MLSNKDVFMTRKAYRLLLGHAPKVTCCNIVLHNLASPRAIFVLWLALLKRLNTRSRLSKWMQGLDVVCPLYDSGVEMIDHLFVPCTYAAELRSKVFHFCMSLFVLFPFMFRFNICLV